MRWLHLTRGDFFLLLWSDNYKGKLKPPVYKSQLIPCLGHKGKAERFVFVEELERP